MADKRKFVTYDQVHDVVDRMPNAYWDGWTIVVHMPDQSGYSKPAGRFYNGKWGFERRFKVRPDGRWGIPVKFL